MNIIKVDNLVRKFRMEFFKKIFFQLELFYFK